MYEVTRALVFLGPIGVILAAASKRLGHVGLIMVDSEGNAFWLEGNKSLKNILKLKVTGVPSTEKGKDNFRKLWEAGKFSDYSLIRTLPDSRLNMKVMEGYRENLIDARYNYFMFGYSSRAPMDFINCWGTRSLILSWIDGL